jgi:hypothetical protein
MAIRGLIGCEDGENIKPTDDKGWKWGNCTVLHRSELGSRVGLRDESFRSRSRYEAA